jgi:high-affinity K+ transport system ATPase subunit B
MREFKNADEYYDFIFERNRRNTPSRIALRYFLSLLTFLIFMIIALSAYWIWKDYAASDYKSISWQSLGNRAAFRWEELWHGRLELD